MDERQETIKGPSRVWLVLFEGGQPHRAVEVRAERFTIGRDAGSDLVLDDPRVSRNHAYLAPSPGPGRLLHDLGSANGTLVDGRRVTLAPGFTAKEERVAELGGGEVIQIGDTIMVVTLRDPGSDLAEAPSAPQVREPEQEEG